MAKSINAADVDTVIFACEAGIGSSLMSVNSLKKKLKKAGVKDLNVIHKATAIVPKDAKLVICHEGIKDSVKTQAPDAVVVSFKMFFNDPIFDKVVKAFVEGTDITEN